MFINDLGPARTGCHLVNAIHWHAAKHGSTQKEARTKRLVDIHINAELGLCSAAMSPSWGPNGAAWSLRTPPLSSHQHIRSDPNCHCTSQKMSSKCPLTVQELPQMSENKVWKFKQEFTFLCSSQNTGQSPGPDGTGPKGSSFKKEKKLMGYSCVGKESILNK